MSSNMARSHCGFGRLWPKSSRGSPVATSANQIWRSRLTRNEVLPSEKWQRLSKIVRPRRAANRHWWSRRAAIGAEDADVAIFRATLPDDGPTGGWFSQRQAIPW
jgi:hypothetical protein